MFDYLGIDWGSKKCGLAIGDSKSGIITPQSIVPTKSLVSSLTWHLGIRPTLTTCIIGTNPNFHGGETYNSQESAGLAATLKAEFPELTVLLYNERGTTSKYGVVRDDYAAAQLLHLYFRFVLKLDMEEKLV